MAEQDVYEELLRIGQQIHKVRSVESQLMARYKALIATAGSASELDDIDTFLASVQAPLAEPTVPATPAAAPRRGRPRRSAYPEGPPLNHKVLEFLKLAKHACGYEDVLREVEAHHQSIQNTLRDLEKRGYVEKMAPNRWAATEKAMKLGGALSVVE